MISPDELAFLTAILANPADDTARLVYADWLDENGGEQGALRAEFIRLQCRIANKDPETPDLRKRQRALVRQNRAEWIGPGFPGRKFERGFVHVKDDDLYIGRGENYDIEMDEFLNHRRSGLLIDTVWLESIPGKEVCRFVEHPKSRLFKEININFISATKDEDMAAIAMAENAPSFHRLDTLLIHDPISDEGFKELFAAKFPRLTRLFLLDTNVSSEAFSIIRKTELPLKHLELREEYKEMASVRISIGNQVLDDIAASPLRLERLTLNGYQVTSGGIDRFVKKEAAQGLIRIEMLENEGDSFLSSDAVVKLVMLPKMETIDFNHRFVAECARIISEAGGDSSVARGREIDAKALRAQIEKGLVIPPGESPPGNLRGR